MKTLEEIEQRMAEIKAELEKPEADLDALNKEVDSLNEERKKLIAQAEIRSKVASGEAGKLIKSFAPIDNPEKREKITSASKEYRSAFLNNLRGVQLNEVESRALAGVSTTGGAPIPTDTLNQIIEKVEDNAPLLAMTTKVSAKGNVTIYVEGTNADASDHEEGAEITGSSDTLVPVSLTPKEIVKLIEISDSVRTMSIDAFETWLVNNIAKAIAKKINAKLIAIMATCASVGTSITTATVQSLLGAVKGVTTLVCNRKTLYTQLLPLQDNSKSSIVKFDGGVATVYGTTVNLDDHVADGTVLNGDLSKIATDLPEDVTVNPTYDGRHNTYLFTGVAQFDAKAAFTEAFAKIAPAA